MKLVNSIKVILVAAAIVGSATSQAGELYGTDDNLSTKLCLSAATGSNLKLISLAKRHRLNMNDVANKIHCNNQDIASFAEQHGATKVANKLRRYQVSKPSQLVAKIN